MGRIRPFRVRPAPGGGRSRLENQDKNEHAENNGVAIRGRTVSHDHRFRNADEHAAKHRARQIADSPQHRSHESLQPGKNSHQRVHRRLLNRRENPRRPGQRRTQSKGERDDEIVVDAHQRRRDGIERNRAHGLAKAGMQDNQSQDHKQRDRHHDDDHLAHGDRQIGEASPALRDFKSHVIDQRRKRLGIGAEDKLPSIFEKKGNADGGDLEDREARLFPERPGSKASRMRMPIPAQASIVAGKTRPAAR